MNEAEVRKIFMLIDNTLTGFSYDDFKVEYWRELLADVPYQVAKYNLDQHLLSPENRFPPTPGQLAIRPRTEAHGYIPNAEETRLMLEGRSTVIDADGTERPLQPVPPPPHLREMVKRLGIGKQ